MEHRHFEEACANTASHGFCNEKPEGDRHSAKHVPARRRWTAFSSFSIIRDRLSPKGRLDPRGLPDYYKRTKQYLEPHKEVVSRGSSFVYAIAYLLFVYLNWTFMGF